MSEVNCIGPACRRPAKARRMCMAHYNQWFTGRSLTKLRNELTTSERFWKQVDKDSGLPCWLWKAGTRYYGYGNFRLRGNGRVASRVAWELTNGPIPGGLWVLHHCDNPPCVNPAHLYVGTPADNAHDRDSRGRAARRQGVSVPVAKLNDSKIREIRALRGAGFASKYVAALFDVSRATIDLIRQGKIWGHVA